MKIRSAVISFSDDEINKILSSLDLPAEIKVECDCGKLAVKIKKGITVTLNIVFEADGRCLMATIEMGVLGNPLVSRILKKALENSSEWGVALDDRTLIFDPQAAMKSSGIQGDFRIDKTAVGAGELVFAIDGDIPLKQFITIADKQ